MIADEKSCIINDNLAHLSCTTSQRPETLPSRSEAFPSSQGQSVARWHPDGLCMAPSASRNIFLYRDTSLRQKTLNNASGFVWLCFILSTGMALSCSHHSPSRSQLLTIFQQGFHQC